MTGRVRPEQLTWVSSGRETRVTAVGGRRVLVENHGGVDEYSREAVRLRCRGGAVRLRGRELALREVRRDALIITGEIAAVEFEHDSPAG